jgi:hypothetical protein
MCVHTRHCCKEHGCKYGEEDSCPVYLQYTKQENLCELCKYGYGDELVSTASVNSLASVVAQHS